MADDLYFLEPSEAIDTLLEIAFRKDGLWTQARESLDVNHSDIRDAIDAIQYLSTALCDAETISRRLATALIVLGQTIPKLFGERAVPLLDELKNEIELFNEEWTQYTECMNEFYGDIDEEQGIRQRTNKPDNGG